MNEQQLAGIIEDCLPKHLIENGEHYTYLYYT